MGKINLAITGCMGRMGQQLIKSASKDKSIKLVSLTENRVVNIPIPKVTEKPLMGPDPIKNRMKAAIKVVILASKIVVLDFV